MHTVKPRILQLTTTGCEVSPRGLLASGCIVSWG